MPSQVKKPPFPRRKYGYIGEPALYGATAKPLIDSWRYLAQWNLNQQWFSFSQCNRNSSGSSPVSGGDDDGTVGDVVNGEFHIILHAPPRTDTTDPWDERHLCGVLLPWRYTSALTVGDAWDYPASVRWQQTGGANQNLWWSYGSFAPGSTPGTSLEWESAIQLGGKRAKFTWTPEAAGGYTFGTLTTAGIRTAALGVWPGPDPVGVGLSSDNAIFDYSDHAPGRPIRGYTGTADLENLGHMIHQAGYDIQTQDSILNNSRICLFQWGHPCGVYNNTAGAYTKVAPDGTTWKTLANKLNDTYDGATLDCECAIIYTCSGATGGNPAYVRYRSPGGDSVVTITSDAASATLTTAFDVDLVLSATDDGDNEFYVESRAPTSGEIVVHTISIWGHIHQNL